MSPDKDAGPEAAFVHCPGAEHVQAVWGWPLVIWSWNMRACTHAQLIVFSCAVACHSWCVLSSVLMRMGAHTSTCSQ